MRMRILGLALLALALLVPATAQAKPRDVEVQLLGINDFHGNLEPPTGSSGRITPAPGATPGRCRRGRVPGDPHPPAAGDEPELAGGLGRRPDRRQPAALGRVPRRADDRGDERDRARSQRGRQPRVRRGRGGAAADAVRRLSSDRHGRHLQGRGRALRRCQLPVPRRQRRPSRHGRAAVPALRDPQVRQHQGRLHRHDAGGHAGHRVAVRHPEPRVPRRGRDRQPLRARSCATSTACGRSSSFSTRAALRLRSPASTPATSPDRSSTSSTAPTTPSTCSSPATPTSRTTA